MFWISLIFFYSYAYFFLQFSEMRASESLLIFVLFILKHTDSQGGKAEAASLSPSILYSKGGSVLPITGEDIGQPWCRIQSFKQTIRRRGCEARTVMKNLCYGQCRSFYIPYRKINFETCSYCTPVSSEMKNIVLNCPDRSPPSQIVKKIKIVTACSCRVCGTRYI